MVVDSTTKGKLDNPMRVRAIGNFTRSVAMYIYAGF